MKHMCVKIRYIYFFLYQLSRAAKVWNCCMRVSLNKLFYFSAVTFSPVYFKNLYYFK
jgi:hypothetical protein